MPMDEERRAQLRARAGVSTRGVQPPPETAALDLVNLAGEGTTDLVAALLAQHGGTAGALALILEGVMLNAAWQLRANALEVEPDDFRKAFAKLASGAVDEVLANTEQPAGETPAG